jgi:AraC-like DNA-binding protein
MRFFMVPHLPLVHADNGGLGLFSPGWIHPARLLTSSVLMLGVKGEMAITVGGDELTLVPGRILVLPAGERHAGAHRIPEPVSYFWVHFTLPEPGFPVSQEEADTILSSEGVTSHRLAEASFLPYSYDLKEPEPFLEEFRELLNQQERPNYTPWTFQFRFRLLLIHLTEAVIRSHRPPATASSSSSVVYGMIACIAENLTDPDLSIKSIAGALGLNLDYAGRRFKQVMTVSVGDYIARERTKVAVSRLKATSDTIDAVAVASGFGSRRNFLRQFKAQIGMTPTELRTQHRMMHFNSY